MELYVSVGRLLFVDRATRLRKCEAFSKCLFAPAEILLVHTLFIKNSVDYSLRKWYNDRKRRMREYIHFPV